MAYIVEACHCDGSMHSYSAVARGADVTHVWRGIGVGSKLTAYSQKGGIDCLHNSCLRQQRRKSYNA